MLAELDDKPWAADDGEPWRATFLIDGELDAATRLELSVAPDINVPLGTAGADRRGDDQPIRARGREPAPASAPRRRRLAPEGASASAQVPSDAAAAPSGATAEDRAPTGERPAARAPDGERLAARLSAAEAALERERERRGESEESLERQRTEVRRLGAELARVRAELELARAAERESAQTAALLDASRSESHALRTRHEALAAEHEQLLHARAALEHEREQLLGSVTSLQDEHDRARRSRDELTRQLASNAGSPEPLPHEGPVPHSSRPLNPSLRSHNWLLRLLVVLVFAGLLLAVYLVLHSTVLH